MDAGSRPRVESHSSTQVNGDYKRDNADGQTKASLPTILTGMSRNVSGPTVSSLISPPDSSRNTQETPDTAHSHPPRQSLPSLREALRSEPEISYSQTTQYAAAYAPAPTSAHTPNSPNSAKRLRPSEASHRDAQQTTSHTPTTSTYVANANYSGTTAYAPFTQPPSSESRTAGWIESQQPSSNHAGPTYQPWTSYTSSPHDSAPRAAAPPTSVYSYGPPPPYTSTHTNHTATSAPAPSHYTPTHPTTWRSPESEHEMKRVEPNRSSQYGESVKRHLDNFDLDNSLNEIAESSNQILKFSDFYRQKSFLAQRNGPVSGSIPPMIEVDEMAKQTLRVQDSLNRLRTIIQTHETEQAERTKESQAKEARMYRQEEATMSNDDLKGTAAIGSDAKKRRGRAAPPGRCHSCNRAETPEWRRGPDGARTLCNACGLHYAKLTRKAANKGSHGGSSLRPKSLDPDSPSL